MPHPKIVVQFEVVDPRAAKYIPKYQSLLASCFDLHILEDVSIPPGSKMVLSTGLAFDVGSGYELQIRPRSGLSLKTSLVIANSPGSIDADYRGVVGIIAFNSGEQVLHFKAGDRVAQGAIAPIFQALFIQKESLNGTDRGSDGFGSTGQ